MSSKQSIPHISTPSFPILGSRAPADPVPIAPERAPPAVDVVVLPQRCQPLLVGAEVQPPVQDAGRVCRLDYPTADQGPVDEVLGGHDAGAVGRDGGDGVGDLGLEGVDVEDGVVLSVSVLGFC